jgi:hypothetical protein
MILNKRKIIYYVSPNICREYTNTKKILKKQSEKISNILQYVQGINQVLQKKIIVLLKKEPLFIDLSQYIYNIYTGLKENLNNLLKILKQIFTKYLNLQKDFCHKIHFNHQKLFNVLNDKYFFHEILEIENYRNNVKKIYKNFIKEISRYISNISEIILKITVLVTISLCLVYITN